MFFRNYNCIIQFYETKEILQKRVQTDLCYYLQS